MPQTRGWGHQWGQHSCGHCTALDMVWNSGRPLWRTRVWRHSVGSSWVLLTSHALWGEAQGLPRWGMSYVRGCCSQVLLLTCSSRLWKGIKLRACSHEWPGCPGNKFNWPWMVFSRQMKGSVPTHHYFHHATDCCAPQLVWALTGVAQAPLCQSECFPRVS